MLGRIIQGTLDLLNHVSLCLMSRGDYEGVVEVWSGLFGEEDGKRWGADHPETLTSFGNLAAVYFDQHAFEKAETVFVDCLERQERVLGVDHVDTLRTAGNIALVRRRAAEGVQGGDEAKGEEKATEVERVTDGDEGRRMEGGEEKIRWGAGDIDAFAFGERFACD
ncbi:hypothetical protein HDV00_004497 [Rhizophlyctis rosea]|nr:hypothetical protein HDV00_004497 [Rhizophlyctis rosea]